VDPQHDMAEMPTERMGPPPGALPPMRMTASWSGSKRTCRIQVCLWRETAPQMASSPRIIPRASVVRRRSFIERLPVIIPPRAQASKPAPGLNRGRCETQATLSGKPQAELAFRSLDPFRALREPDCRRRDEERPFRSEQKTGNNQNDYLTGKAPYKSRELSLPKRRSPICDRP
jgi:hypothetical protein